MGGKSDQEKASEQLFGQISGFDPRVKNRFDDPNLLAFDPKSMVRKFQQGTQSGIDQLKRATGENVKTAQKSTAAGLQSRGLGGSILEDAIAKSRAKASGQGTSAINDLLVKSQQLLPGVMNQANRTSLGVAQGAQGADFQNIMNMFRKFGAQGGALGGLDDSTLFTDILDIGKTAASFIPLFG
jgi:hypothetical protein